MNSPDDTLPPTHRLCLSRGKMSIEQKRLQIFESQDVENEQFDVTFDIEGKQLHAHKFMLSSQSEIFKTMFSTRWSTNNDPIQIANRTFDDFKTFIGYTYFAPVDLSRNNLMTMVDMAEYYGVEWIKNECDAWLSRKKFAPLFDLYEAAKRYSLKRSKKAILSYILDNCSKEMNIVNDFSKECILDIVTSQRSNDSEGSLFKAVYTWAIEKHRHLDNSMEALHQAIKIELADILPHMKFEVMCKPFLNDFIYPIKHIFGDDNWKGVQHIFENPQVILKSNQYLDNLRGVIFADAKIVDAIKSLNNVLSSVYKDRFGCYWHKRCKIPSKPSQIRIKEKVPYYLCISADYHRIAVIQRSDLIDGDYLLAELNGTYDRHFHLKCRIYIK